MWMVLLLVVLVGRAECAAVVSYQLAGCRRNVVPVSDCERLAASPCNAAAAALGYFEAISQTLLLR